MCPRRSGKQSPDNRWAHPNLSSAGTEDCLADQTGFRLDGLGAVIADELRD